MIRFKCDCTAVLCCKHQFLIIIRSVLEQIWLVQYRSLLIYLPLNNQPVFTQTHANISLLLWLIRIPPDPSHCSSCVLFHGLCQFFKMLIAWLNSFFHKGTCVCYHVWVHVSLFVCDDRWQQLTFLWPCVWQSLLYLVSGLMCTKPTWRVKDLPFQK